MLLLRWMPAESRQLLIANSYPPRPLHRRREAVHTGPPPLRKPNLRVSPRRLGTDPFVADAVGLDRLGPSPENHRAQEFTLDALFDRFVNGLIE